MTNPLYQLTCPCGKTHPVETTQAGRSIPCPCGRTLSVPSMMKIKRLPFWPEETSPQADGSETVVSATGGNSAAAAVPARESTPASPQNPQPALSKADGVSATRMNPSAAAEEKTGSSAAAPPISPNSAVSPADPARKSSFFAPRKGIMIVGSVMALLFAALLIRSVTTPPQPIDVLRIQRFYLQGEKVIQRDSSPIEPSDAFFFVTADNHVVNDWMIDHFAPFYAYEYFDYLKNGPKLSDNFYDKLDSLSIRRRLMEIFYGVMVLASLGIASIPFFMSKRQKTVGVMRGSEWKS